MVGTKRQKFVRTMLHDVLNTPHGSVPSQV